MELNVIEKINQYLLYLMIMRILKVKISNFEHENERRFMTMKEFYHEKNLK